MAKKIGKRGIKITDTEALQEALAAVNGRASSHTLDINNITALSEEAEKELVDAGLAKTVRVSATAKFYGFAPSASSYKYAATTTEMTIKRFSEGWRVMSLARTSMSPGDRKRGQIYVALTNEQYEKAESFLLGHFRKQAA